MHGSKKKKKKKRLGMSKNTQINLIKIEHN